MLPEKPHATFIFYKVFYTSMGHTTDVTHLSSSVLGLDDLPAGVHGPLESSANAASHNTHKTMLKDLKIITNGKGYRDGMPKSIETR